MIKEQALKIVDELIVNQNIKKHCLAAGAAMDGIWEYFKGKGQEVGEKGDWEVVGLLHDADYEVTNKDLEKHTEVISEKIKEKVSGDVIDAIKGHGGKITRKTLMAKAIYAADDLTGLIVAAALVRPDKKLEGLTSESVLKRFKEPAFAKGADREIIKTCESELQIPLAEFVEIVLNSMKKIAGELGL